MGRPKKVKEETVSQIPPVLALPNKVGILTQEFGNGELNVLRDKLNEVIKTL